MVKNSHFETLYKIRSHDFCLEYKKILEKLSIGNSPVGMGGCRNEGSSYDCCEYDITIFDGKKQKESFLEYNGNFYYIYVYWQDASVDDCIANNLHTFCFVLAIAYQ